MGSIKKRASRASNARNQSSSLAETRFYSSQQLDFCATNIKPKGNSVNMKTIYLALAIVGAVVPYVFFVQQMQLTGFGLQEFLAAAFANPVASGFASDLIISSIVFWIVIFRRRTADNGPRPTIFIILNLLIGLSCALPAYLYAHEKARQ